jgi:N-acetylglucosamine-6-phosphate deacetylase
MTSEVLQGTLVLPDRLIEGGKVVIDDGTIQAIVENSRGHRPTHDLGDAFIAPGFIDLHVHGIAGVDTMDAARSSLALMAERFAAHGVTSFLPTTMTESIEATVSAVSEVGAYMADADHGSGPRSRVLGVHLEGPWISPQFKGAQNERYIVEPDEQSVHAILAAAAGCLRRVTLAPERPGAEDAIRMLRARGTYISIGHSGATYEEALRAVDLGASHFTHCFNAMTALYHRRPGVVGAALLSRDTFAELIADAIHVHPDVMRLLIQIKGRGRVLLVTDAMAAAERPDGPYVLGGQDVVVRNGDARLADGTLAGSTLVMDQAVRNLVELCHLSVVDAVYMASASPAEAIGLGATKGKIRVGYDADLAILDRMLRPRAIVIAGDLSQLNIPAASVIAPR